MPRETTEESGMAKGARRATKAVPGFRSRGTGRWTDRCKVTAVLGSGADKIVGAVRPGVRPTSGLTINR